MDGDTQPPPADIGSENQPPPAEIEGQNELPPAETEDEIQHPLAEKEGETQQLPAEIEDQSQPLPACVSKVLDDDNLLPEIIVRVGFPTSLVRTASVCRRWLKLASDRAFLRRFRKLNPPRLLGFYLAHRDLRNAVSFFPMLPQPPPLELATVVPRASFSLDIYERGRYNMVGCWNGRVVSSLQIWHQSYVDTRYEILFGVHSPLCSERGMAVIPPLHPPLQKGSFYACQLLLSKEEGDAVSYFYIMVENTWEEKSAVKVYMLRNGDDAWRTHLTLTVDYLIDARSKPGAVLIDSKIYMATARNEIFVLDLMASSFSAIQLPQGVDFHTTGTTMLSRVDDTSASDVYLIHTKEFQLHIWLYKGGNWLLVENICLREMCAHLLEDEPTALLQINHVGDYTGDFLFLLIGRSAHYLDVKCRTLRKVYEMTDKDGYPCSIYPFLMIWPPIFPVLKDGSQAMPCEEQGQEETLGLSGTMGATSEEPRAEFP